MEFIGGKIIDVLSEKKLRLEVDMVKNLLTDYQNQSESETFELLKQLLSAELSVEAVKTTKIEETVKLLSKHPVKKIKHLAKSLIYSWKDLHDVCLGPDKDLLTISEIETREAENHLKNADPQIAKQEEQPSYLLALPAHCLSLEIENSLEVRSMPFTMPPPHGVVMDKEQPFEDNPQDIRSKQMPMDQPPQGLELNIQHAFENKINISKRKLREAYLKEDKSKKQRCVKLLGLEELPRALDHQCRRPKLSSRRFHGK